MTDSNEISSQINSAIAAHALWKVRLNDAIENQTSEFDVDFVRSPHNCDFGKWLNENQQTLKEYELFDNVCKIHSDVHKETAAIMEKAINGHKEDAQNALENSFKNISMELTKTMMAWKKVL